MAKLEIPDEQLKEIVAEVEKELEIMFKSEQLLKAFPDKKEDKPEPKDEGKMAAAPDDKGPSADAPAAPPSAIEAQPEPAAPPMEAAPAAPEMAPHMEPDGDEMGGIPELEALKVEYASLAPEELRMHAEAAMHALLDLMGGHGAADPQMPPSVPSLPPVPIPGAGADMGKMELEAIAPNKKADGGEDHLTPTMPSKKFGPGENHLEAVYVKAKKSEDDLALKIKEVEELKKNQEKTDEALMNLTNVFKMVLEKPERKAVTSISAMGKPGESSAPEAKPLTKSEVMAKLNTITRDPSLKKTDREAVNSYCVGSIGLDKIAHLLK